MFHLCLKCILQKQINSEANFHFGDVTKNTEFNNGNFSLINSVAVLEHLNDMNGALKEMNELLIPGGLMIHSYDPYFHPSGGHDWYIRFSMGSLRLTNRSMTDI